MLKVLRQRNFALLWIGQVISLIGDWVLTIALPFYIYALTGSALATGAMFIAVTLPRLLLGSLAGVFVDRWDRRWTMIAADVSRALLLPVLLIVRSSQWLWIVYVVAFVESAISQFFIPAKSAIIPRLVGEEHLVAANSLDALSDALTRLIGPAIGGALFAFVGIGSVVYIDSASYLFSGLMILLILMPPVQRKEETNVPVSATSTPWAKVWRDWLEGLRLVKKERLLMGIFMVTGITMIATGFINVLLVVFVKKSLHGDALVLGWLTTAQGSGGMIGALTIGQVGKLLRPIYLIILGLGTAGVFLFFIVNIPVLPLDLVLTALIGLTVVGFFVTVQTLLQKGVADEYRGRVFGAFGTTNALLMLIGMGIASSLGDTLGVVILLDIAGGLFLLAVVLAMLTLQKAAISNNFA